MGGAKSMDRPSNIIVICARLNFELESSKAQAAQGRLYGWKISKSSNPALEPVYDPLEGVWWALGDDFSRTIAEIGEKKASKIEAGLDIPL